MARPSSTTPSSDHFVPHIQGLRAIAVLLVVVYHFWPGRLPGGFIGVDVFFVISGFLITGQLTRELSARARIDLPSFWAKRIRRLIPASLFVLAVSAVLTAFVMPLAYLHESLWDIGASALYWQNWHLAAGSVNYLASTGSTIAEHYWSLAVEEQFYVVWPLLLLGGFALGAKFAAARRWTFVVGTVIVVAIVSLALSVWFTGIDPAQAYFVLFTRMWEFAAGALLALFPALRFRSRWSSNIFGLAGLGLVFASAVLLTGEVAFPGWIALIPVAGTVLILALNPAHTRFSVTGVLSSRPFTFVGDISYSLYLWHWPLIVVAPFIIGWGLGTVNRIILFAAGFVLAWLTKKLIEDPFRRLPYLVSRKPRFTFGWMLVSLGLIGALLAGVFAYAQPRYEVATAELVAVTDNPPECFGAAVITGCSNADLDGVVIPSPEFGSADRPTHEECFVQLNESDLVTCTFGSTAPNAPRVALIGDSHAYQYIDALIRQSEKNGWSLTTYLKGACPRTMADPDDSNPAFIESCRTWRANLAVELADIEPYDAIITSALSSGLVAASGNIEQASIDADAAWTAQSRSARIVVIADNPAVGFDPNNCLRAGTPQSCEFSRADALVSPDPLGLAADLVAKTIVVDFTDVFCDTSTCQVVISGANVYRDQDHLTATFANTMGPTIAATVNAVLRAR